MQISEICTGGFRKVIHMLNYPFCKFELWFCNLEVISQLGDDFATWRWFATSFAAWRWFRNVVRNYEDGGMGCKMALVGQRWVSQLISQLRNGLWAVKFSLIFARLSSNSHNFFVSTLIRVRLKRWTPDFPSLETTYSMHEMDSRKYSKYVQQFLSSWILHVRFLSLFFLLAFLIGFGKELQSSKAWILHVNELSFALPWII